MTEYEKSQLRKLVRDKLDELEQMYNDYYNDDEEHYSPSIRIKSIILYNFIYIPIYKSCFFIKGPNDTLVTSLPIRVPNPALQSIYKHASPTIFRYQNIIIISCCV